MAWSAHTHIHYWAEASVTTNMGLFRVIYKKKKVCTFQMLWKSKQYLCRELFFLHLLMDSTQTALFQTCLFPASLLSTACRILLFLLVRLLWTTAYCIIKTASQSYRAVIRKHVARCLEPFVKQWGRFDYLRSNNR